VKGRFLLWVLPLVLVAGTSFAEDSLKFKELGKGWSGLAKQADPFDKSKLEFIQITKGAFTFRCGELNMAVRSPGYESLSFPATIKYKIDGGAPFEKPGRYSTYLGGSELVTDDRYYSFRLSEAEVDALEAGASVIVAGNYSAGWETKELSLAGFAAAYSQMCKE